MHFTFDTWLALLGVILALVAIVMAIPPFLQMLCGRPKLNVGVDEFTGSEDKQLLVTMKNKAVQRRLLRRIGVIRDVGEVMAYFDIQEQGTNKFIAKNASGQMNCAPTREIGLLVRALPAFHVGFPVIAFRANKAWIVDARVNELSQLPAGHYRVDATIICGEQIYRLTKNMKIGSTAHETRWI
jgi:hypothetical protein